MIAIIIFIGIIIGLNCIPLLTKLSFPKTEKIIKRILIVSTVLLLIFLTFEVSGYKLKGLYTFAIIGMIFIIFALIYFAIFKNTKKKIMIVFLLTPLIVLSIFIPVFNQTIYKNTINEKYNIEIREGGFLACGETLKITEPKFGIFDKEVFHENSLCLQGVNKIKVLEFDEKLAKFLIYHNGNMDSENPCLYEMELKNAW
jgi:ABC-2 type transport system permease protein